MRRFAVNTLGLGMVLVLVGACTSGPESTIDVPPGQTDSDDVTGGEIIVSGDLDAGTAAADPGAGETAGAPATTSAPPSDHHQLGRAVHIGGAHTLACGDNPERDHDGDDRSRDRRRWPGADEPYWQ